MITQWILKMKVLTAKCTHRHLLFHLDERLFTRYEFLSTFDYRIYFQQFNFTRDSKYICIEFHLYNRANSAKGQLSYTRCECTIWKKQWARSSSHEGSQRLEINWLVFKESSSSSLYTSVNRQLCRWKKRYFYLYFDKLLPLLIELR